MTPVGVGESKAERELTAADWRGYGQEQFPATAWSVDEDVLRAMASGPKIDLISRERFRDFTLSFDWRLPRGGHSGVAYRVRESSVPAWQSGPVIQLLDDEHHRLGADALSSCGALFGLMAPWHDQRNVANVYYGARVVVRGSVIEHWINERQVIGCDLAADDMRNRIERSRLRDCRDFGRESEGHIVLQHCGTEAWFRKIRIEPL
ncbi:MAG TPA: DUF1080 domain-containing protein [Steroidobacteraceae bacterium]|nr:DUF1080 domain-containing protein [Steroidobacteraceae bacterium]